MHDLHDLQELFRARSFFLEKTYKTSLK